MAGELILDDLSRHARERPDARAVVEVRADGATRELTWSALADETDRVAAALEALGVGNGDTVAFQLPNRNQIRGHRAGDVALGSRV